MKDFLCDLFKGPGNKHWDFARIMGFQAFWAFTGAFLYGLIHLKNVPDWAALGVGYTGLLGGIAALILGKDFSTAKNQIIKSEAEPPPGP